MPASVDLKTEARLQKPEPPKTLIPKLSGAATPPILAGASPFAPQAPLR